MRETICLAGLFCVAGCFHVTRELGQKQLSQAVQIHGLNLVAAGGLTPLTPDEVTKCSNAYIKHSDAVDAKRNTVLAFGVLTGAGGIATGVIAGVNPHTTNQMTTTTPPMSSETHSLNSLDIAAIVVGAISSGFGVISSSVAASSSADQDKMKTILGLITDGTPNAGSVAIYCR